MLARTPSSAKITADSWFPSLIRDVPVRKWNAAALQYTLSCMTVLLTPIPTTNSLSYHSVNPSGVPR